MAHENVTCDGYQLLFYLPFSQDNLLTRSYKEHIQRLSLGYMRLLENLLWDEMVL